MGQMSGDEWDAALKACPLIMEPPPAASFRQKDDMIAKLNRENISLQAKLDQYEKIQVNDLANAVHRLTRENISLQAKLGTLQGAHDRLMADFNALMARAAKTLIVPQPVGDVFPVNALRWSGENGNSRGFRSPRRRGSGCV